MVQRKLCGNHDVEVVGVEEDRVCGGLLEEVRRETSRSAQHNLRLCTVACGYAGGVFHRRRSASVWKAEAFTSTDVPPPFDTKLRMCQPEIF